ncbi:MAG: hypothetical protein HQK55_14340 [Deltaproteobacteria bacterium]|nr:hypothetical protein [Deltaproteobacteria bacterium]
MKQYREALNDDQEPNCNVVFQAFNAQRRDHEMAVVTQNSFFDLKLGKRFLAWSSADTEIITR